VFWFTKFTYHSPKDTITLVHGQKEGISQLNKSKTRAQGTEAMLQAKTENEWSTWEEHLK
jgi:hypothetical protein